MAINDNSDDLSEQERPYYRDDPDAPRTLFSPGPPHASQSLNLFGMWLFIASLTMLFAGSLIVLWRVARRAEAGLIDHENAYPVRNAAIYWHFLDVVWITMFLTFRVMG